MKFSAITGSLGNIGDRYVLKGYKPEMRGTTLEQKLDLYGRLPGVSGLEISQADVDGMTAAQVRALFDSRGLGIAAVGLDVTGDAYWKYGSITSPDPDVRARAMEVMTQAVELAAGVGCPLVNVWLGQEGFDYPFQVDYAAQFSRAVEAFAELADVDPDTQIALEPKCREPRNRSFLDTATTAILIAQDTNRDNVGVTLDVGHVLQEGRNMAQAVAYAHLHGRLFHLHINDNYGAWDDDMTVGAVHATEFVELFRLLQDIGYDKWMSVDIFPYREQGVSALAECLDAMAMFRRLAASLDPSVLAQARLTGDVLPAMRHVRERIYK